MQQIYVSYRPYYSDESKIEKVVYTNTPINRNNTICNLFIDGIVNNRVHYLLINIPDDITPDEILKRFGRINASDFDCDKHIADYSQILKKET